MITQIIRKQFFGVTDVSAIGKSIHRELFCVVDMHRSLRKYLVEAPELHNMLTARKPCVTSVLCKWENNSKFEKCV